jgi:hypothetical protein
VGKKLSSRGLHRKPSKNKIFHAISRKERLRRKIFHTLTTSCGPCDKKKLASQEISDTVSLYGKVSEEGGFMPCSGVQILSPDCSIASGIFHLLSAFREEQSKRRNASPLHLAWIFTSNSLAEPSSEVLASIGFPPSQTIYIETAHPQRALTAICAEHFFSAIVYSANTTPSALHIARKWIKPQTDSIIISGSQLEEFNPRKIIIFGGTL